MKKLSHYEKIKQVLDNKGIKVAKAEGMAGLGGGTIAKLKDRKDGKGELHEDNLQKFLRTFNVSKLWWDKGEGEMFNPENQVSEPTVKYETADELRQVIAAHEKTIAHLEKTIAAKDETIAAMEKTEELQDRLLDQYRMQLEDCKLRLTKIESTVKK